MSSATRSVSFVVKDMQRSDQWIPIEFALLKRYCQQHACFFRHVMRVRNCRVRVLRREKRAGWV